MSMLGNMSKADQKIKYIIDSGLMEVHGQKLYDTTKKRYRKLTDDGRGYLVINLLHTRVFVHRIIAYTVFGDSIFNSELEVNHIDENPKNNLSSNLELVSHKKNMEHSSYKQKGENNPSAKLTVKDVIKIKEALSKEESTQEEIALVFGVNRTTISSIANKRSWSFV